VKGELLFSEGENSKAMYLVKSGMIRIFKKKAEGFIELDTIRAGSILGELAFLDGLPRSASGEALTEVELIEISGPTFKAVLDGMPEWLKILLKTIVGRLRTASTRIRQLEAVSTAVDYSDKAGGKRGSNYAFLLPSDILKTCSALLLVASRSGKAAADGLEFKASLLERYAGQIMQIPMAKVSTVIETLAECGICRSTPDGETITLMQPDFLEQSISYMNEENLAEPSKRKDITSRSFFIMSLIARRISEYPEDANGVAKVNLAKIAEQEKAVAGKEVFRFDELGELVKLGYATNVAMKSATEAITEVKARAFIQAYRFQRVVMGFAAANEQKRKGSVTPAAGSRPAAGSKPKAA